MNKNYKSEQNGRSMVEMLGVLAVIGVLSITGISGYTTAMNKHKANEILDAASKRAVAVSTQIQRGNTNPTLAEFEDNEVGGAKFNTTVEKVGSSQFKLTFATAPSDDVKTQIKSMTGDGTGTVLVDDNVSRFLYNNDLSAGVSNTNNRDTSDATKCASGYKGADCDTCDTDNGYILNTTSGKCEVEGTPYRRGGSTLGTHIEYTATEGGCPTGYRWATNYDVKTLEETYIVSIFTDSELCEDCSKSDNSYWLKDCWDEDDGPISCKSPDDDSAYVLDSRGFSPATWRKNKHYALCVKK